MIFFYANRRLDAPLEPINSQISTLRFVVAPQASTPREFPEMVFSREQNASNRPVLGSHLAMVDLC
jgi:hypothetical protein